MNSPLVSIITVVSPASPPIERIAQSVLRQTFRQWEWLIVNPGLAAPALDRLRAADPRIRVIDMSDRAGGEGVGAARRLGVGAARAGTLLLLDRDDALEPAMLEQWLWCLESYPEYVMLKGDTRAIGGQTYLLPNGLRQPEQGLLESAVAQTSMLRKAAYPGLVVPASGARWPQPRHLRWRQAIPNTLPFQNQLERRKPALLMILPWLTMGGADKFNLDLLRLLAEQYGYEVSIATLEDGDHTWLPLFAKHAAEIFALHHFLRLADYPRFLRYLIGSRQIDTVMVSNTFLGYGLLPYLRAHCPGVTFVDYLHAEDDHWKNGGFPRASLEQAAQLDLTVVASMHLKQWLIDHGGNPGRIEVCTVNIDTADWNPERYDRAALRRELGIGADAAVILYAARICLQKQPKLLADVMIELERQNQQFVCLVAGDGPDRPWLEQFVKSKNVQSIRMLGLVSNQRMHELMAISDIFFLPSEMEGISMAIYEAMAMGAVPVGADVGGQRELVTPECGILVPRDREETARYTDALLRLLRDPDLRMRMRQAARQRVEQGFGIEQMGARMAQLLGQAREMARHAPRPAVSPEAGLETAARALRQLRKEQAADRIKTALPGARRALRPIYRWAAAHVLPGLAALRGWAFQRLPAGGKR